MDYSAIRQNFEKHGFLTQLFSTKEQARDYLVEKLQKKTIGFGGSVTLRDMGLYEALRENNAVIWHNVINDIQVRHLANQAEIYITSSNAVTETGELVNIDGSGNRVAMMAFGPQQIYYIVGKNKITPDVSQAIHRCRNVAAPQNAHRLKSKTPCAVKGDKCYNCNSPGRICRILEIIERAPFNMTAEIIFVDQDLGM